MAMMNNCTYLGLARCSGAALLALALGASACSDDSSATGSESASDSATETGDGDGDSDGSESGTASGDGDGDMSGDGDGDPATGDGDGDPATGDGDGDMSGDGDGDMSGDGDGDPAECGNGVVEGDEMCDDGNDDNTDACTTECLPAACGDGYVQADVEDCDDGNDDDADACTSLCAAPACDDGIVSGDETDLDCGGSCPSCEFGQLCELGADCSTFACVDGACGYAVSCAELLAQDPDLPDGTYAIDPDGDGGSDPYDVVCEMTTNGGGWTLVMISSDDDVDTWTWNNRAYMGTDATTVGDVDTLDADFKSPAYNQLLMSDLMFVHAPSGDWAQYDGVGDGSQDLGTHIEAIGVPICDLSLAGNGHELTDGTIMAGNDLCDTDLYFNLGDHEVSENVCQAMVNSQWSPATYGPAWNGGFNSGCHFDDPVVTSFGPSSSCENCQQGTTDTEVAGLGFGYPLQINSGEAGTGANNLRLYIR